jgi:hypothetical protein
MEAERMAKMPKYIRPSYAITPWRELTTKLHQGDYEYILTRRLKWFKLRVKA